MLLTKEIFSNYYKFHVISFGKLYSCFPFHCIFCFNWICSDLQFIYRYFTLWFDFNK